MYGQLQKFKQLQDISLREIQNMSFDIFAQISFVLVQGINLKPRLVKLYNDCSCILLPKRTSLSESQRYEIFTREDYEEKFFELLQFDTQIQAGNLKIQQEREKYILQLIKVYNNDTFIKYQQSLKTQAKERIVQKQQEAANQLETKYTQPQVLEKHIEKQAAQSKFQPKSIPPKSLNTRPSSQPQQLNQLEQQLLQTNCILQKLPDFYQAHMRKLNINTQKQPLLYLSTKQLVVLLDQLMNQEKQFMILKTHVQNSKLNFENLSEKLLGLRRISVQFNKFLEQTTELPKECRTILLDAGNRLKLADQAAEKIQKGTKIDVDNLVSISEQQERSIMKNNELRSIRYTEDLVDISQQLRRMLSKQREGEQVDLEEILIDFEQKLNQFIYKQLNCKNDQVEKSIIQTMFE
ncbi:hypothetical protein SS50377_21168 [Spironucleus salmonicida]|uniref:Uncharacterized protein n=1 Tax=Spironucleus salmonicida TaxID=348837 RepID=V6LHC4_9EUKA|nr:hypothetical protein SS50377_21168 [Spironucleus salmonicida]|eukprot:EST43947.1 Hypothetical protein SS50377_16250 [Spironucleus salmonicida]